MDVGVLVAAVVFFAFFVEWAVERFAGEWAKGQGEVMIYISAALGVALCLLFRLDALAILQLPNPIGAPYTGQVVTGIIVGSGSNAVHQFFGKYLPKNSGPSPTP